jgi:hypothetical protein
VILKFLHEHESMNRMNRRQLLQEDFNCLTAAGSLDADLHQCSVETSNPHGIESNRSRKRHACMEENSRETFYSAPQHFQTASLDLETLAETIQKINFEPVRSIASAGPPKRFYRTFWRSLARRAMDAYRHWQSLDDDVKTWLTEEGP